MSTLEDLRLNASIRGIIPDALATVVNVTWFGSDAIELTYKGPAGKVANELLYRHDEPRIEEGRRGQILPTANPRRAAPLNSIPEPTAAPACGAGPRCGSHLCIAQDLTPITEVNGRDPSGQSEYHNNDIGSNLKPYFTTASGRLFGGNQYVSVAKLSEIGKIGGYAFFVAATAYEGAQVWRGDSGASAGKWAVDTGVGGASVWIGGLPGGILGGAYFAVDQYYPGGWHGLAKHTSGDCSYAIGNGLPCQ